MNQAQSNAYSQDQKIEVSYWRRKLMVFGRVVLFVGTIVRFFATAFWISKTESNAIHRRQRLAENVRDHARFCLSVLGVDLKVSGVLPQGRFLMVANHMGFIDILFLASQIPMTFVTSVEMRDTPFLGWITDMGGCLYVERRSRSSILRELEHIAQALKEGFRIVLYPESVSTNGEQVLPFKRTLLMSAAMAGVPIQPVVVNFKSIDGEEFSTLNRDSVCWYGSTPFVTAILRTFETTSIEAEIEFLPMVRPTPETNRAELADTLHAMISSRFQPVKRIQPELLDVADIQQIKI
jgi:1-acyl-sn-glycerol-3-phosphate acyltransferase